MWPRVQASIYLENSMLLGNFKLLSYCLYFRVRMGWGNDNYFLFCLFLCLNYFVADFLLALTRLNSGTHLMAVVFNLIISFADPLKKI